MRSSGMKEGKKNRYKRVVHTMKNIMRISASLVVMMITLACGSLQADMLISPTRVLLDKDHKSATLVLRNPSDGPRSYRLSWEDKRSKEEGGYGVVGADEDWPSAKDMVRVSPRQITVGPNENQTVRFSWRPPADLASGEFRSHLLLEVIPDVSEPTATLEGKGPREGVGIQVFMQMSFSIPVVVRHETGIPQVAINAVNAVALKDGKHMGLELTLDRTGNASSFGRVLVEMQRSADSPVEKIGEYRDLSIYKELNKRKITIPLRDASIPEGAWVRIAYEGVQEYEGILWAEKVFQAL